MSDTSRRLAARIRAHAVRMVHKARASHVASALSIADIVAVLYGGVLRVDPRDPADPGRDRFVLSKGHACVAVYAALAERGFFAAADLESYGADHSVLMNHISHKVPGVEFSTGSLGHGLPFATGKALAAARRGLGWRSVALLSDGELDEGSNWEAILFAAHHRLGNLLAIVDANGLQSLTTVDATLRLEPLGDKFRAFGWDAVEVDGHDHAALEAACAAGAGPSDRPRVVVARTVKGKGVSYMENTVDWHYRSPSDDDLRRALAEIGEPA